MTSPIPVDARVWLTVVCQPCSAGWWGPQWSESDKCPMCGATLVVRGRTVVTNLDIEL